MLEKEVEFSFSCGHCGELLTVRANCSGDGVAAGPHAVTCAAVPCPYCQQTNEVYFELSGLVLAVELAGPWLEPSLN